MGKFFEPEYLHIGIMLCVIAGIVLFVIIFVIVYLYNKAQETKGMTKEQKKAYREKQKAIKEQQLAEQRNKPICENCVHYDGYGHCKVNSKQKWVDIGDDDGYYKTVYLRVNSTSTCNGFVNKYSESGKRIRDREEGIPEGFKK